MHFSKNHVLYISDLYISSYVNLAKKKKMTTKFELKKKNWAQCYFNQEMCFSGEK